MAPYLDFSAKKLDNPAMIISAEKTFAIRDLFAFSDEFFVQEVVLNKPFVNHDHEFCEIVIMLSGKGVHRINGIPYSMNEGNCYVIRGKTTHSFSDVEDMKMMNVMVSENSAILKNITLLTNPGFRTLFEIEPKVRSEAYTSFFSLVPHSKKKAITICRYMIDELQAMQDGWEEAVLGLLQYFLIFISQCYSSQVHPERTENTYLINLGRALAFIENNYTEQLKIETIADNAHMSTRHLFRNFKKVIGSTPNDYICTLRLQKASQLLHDRSKTITDIAYDCGFSDSNYFSRVFKKYFGATPREYRSRLYRG